VEKLARPPTPRRSSRVCSKLALRYSSKSVSQSAAPLIGTVYRHLFDLLSSSSNRNHTQSLSPRLAHHLPFAACAHLFSSLRPVAELGLLYYDLKSSCATQLPEFQLETLSDWRGMYGNVVWMKLGDFSGNSTLALPSILL